MQHCLSEINSSSRCRLYKELEQVFTPESYLSVRMDKKLHTSYTKFRLSSHKLLVERGGWMKPELQYEMRKCTICDSEDIEDEYHVILVCQQDLRTKYIKKSITIRDQVCLNLLSLGMLIQNVSNLN